MPYLLDTDILRYYLDEVPEAITFVNELIPEGIALSIITYMELYQGTLQTPDPSRAQERLTTLLETVLVLPLSPAVARRCAYLREELKSQGKRVRQRALDLLIAATALDQEFTLAPRNRGDFADLPRLQTLFYEL